MKYGICLKIILRRFQYHEFVFFFCTLLFLLVNCLLFHCGCVGFCYCCGGKVDSVRGSENKQIEIVCRNNEVTITYKNGTLDLSKTTDGKLYGKQIVNGNFINKGGVVYCYRVDNNNAYGAFIDYLKRKNGEDIYVESEFWRWVFSGEQMKKSTTYLFALVTVNEVQYLVYCENANSIKSADDDFLHSLFDSSDATKIEILSCGNNITNMCWMFYNCSKLTELDLSKLKIGNVKDMSRMFYNCFKEDKTSILICPGKAIDMITRGSSNSNLNKVKVKIADDTLYKCIVVREKYNNTVKINVVFNVENNEKKVEIKIEENKEENKVTITCPNGTFDLLKTTKGIIDDKKIVNGNFISKGGVVYCHRVENNENIEWFKGKKLPDVSNTYLFAYVEVKINKMNNNNVIRCLVYCENANSVEEDNNTYCSLFDSSDATKIKILSCGSDITNVQYMFYYCSSLENLDLSNFNTNKVKNMEGMFSDCSSLQNLDLSNFNTDSVTDMSNMFTNCTKLTELNLSNFNTSNVKYMYNMFFDCSKLTNITFSDKFKIDNVESMESMFYKCFKEGEKNTLICSGKVINDIINKNYSCLKKGDKVNIVSNYTLYKCIVVRENENQYHVTITKAEKQEDIKEEIEGEVKKENNNVTITYWEENNKPKSITLSKTINGKVDNNQIVNGNFISKMEVYCSKVGNDIDIDIEKYKKVTLNNAGNTYLFAYVEVNNRNNNVIRCLVYCEDANNVFNYVNNYGLFQNSKATEIKILSCGSDITNMQNMFDFCTELTELDLSKLKTNKVINMSNMFYYCTKLTELNLSNFNTDSVKDISNMFYNCSDLTELNLSQFNTNKIENMSYMFYGCFQDNTNNTLICPGKAIKQITKGKSSCLKKGEGVNIENDGAIYECTVVGNNNEGTAEITKAVEKKKVKVEKKRND